MPARVDTLVSADTWAPTHPIRELDELWTFVVRKTDDVWIWIALCRQSRQVIAFVVGDRSAVTCRQLWNAIPQPYCTAICYRDFWSAYTAVIPSTQHRPVGKEAGETAHVERYNNTLRQRLSQLVRATLSFAKATPMLIMTLQRFIHRYNEECADILRM